MNEKLENMSSEVSLDHLKALAAVSAERDWHRSHYERLLQENVTLRADRDRLHKAITEALGELGAPESKGPWLSGNIPNAVRRILRAALDKEGEDDE